MTVVINNNILHGKLGCMGRCRKAPISAAAVQCSGLQGRPSSPLPLPCPACPGLSAPNTRFRNTASAFARRKMEIYFLHWKTMKYQGQRVQLNLTACSVRRVWHLMGFRKGSLQKMVRMSFASVPKAMDHKVRGPGLPP